MYPSSVRPSAQPAGTVQPNGATCVNLRELLPSAEHPLDIAHYGVSSTKPGASRAANHRRFPLLCNFNRTIRKVASCHTLGHWPERRSSIKTAARSFRCIISHKETREVKEKREPTPHEMANIIIKDDVEFAKLKHAMRETVNAKTSMGFQMHFRDLAKERLTEISKKTEQLHVDAGPLILSWNEPSIPRPRSLFFDQMSRRWSSVGASLTTDSAITLRENGDTNPNQTWVVVEQRRGRS
jgi:hypothetical protein